MPEPTEPETEPAETEPDLTAEALVSTLGIPADVAARWMAVWNPPDPEPEPEPPPGPPDPYADLAGLAEVAADLGVTVWRVKRWVERRHSTECPDPVRRLHVGYIYSLAAWRSWYALWSVTRGQTYYQLLEKEAR